VFRPFYLFWFKVLGWKITGRFPPELRKYIMAVGPHTSNWDFFLGVAVRSILQLQQAKFLGKSQLFKPPFGWLFRALGGFPVERSGNKDMVEQVTAIIKVHDDFRLAMAPEGTRKKVERLRTGFYYIAKAANIPVIPVGFDFGNKQVVIGQPLWPTTIEHDMPILVRFFAGIKGRNPELGINGTEL
jgi:1-acyl-sn-glycerol-3-phosphate acyltransferase